MRRSLAVAIAAGFIAVSSVHDVFAQGRGRERGGDSAAEDAARQRRMDEEMALDNLPLPDVVNAGPCPFVKVLYDAARQIDFKDDRQSANAVVFSGEIEGLSARCAYKASEPITVTLLPTFSFGRGPQATEPTRTFHYWVAVTERNASIMSKEFFTVTPQFNGLERVTVVGETVQVTIPRLDDKVSGSNFEVLVGFEVTPKMAAFNRQGSRFLVNAASGTTTTVTTGTPPTQ